MADTNKVKYGLKSAHYAVITEVGGVISFGTPVPLPGAVNLSIKPSGDSVTFEADDTTYYENNINNGYEGSLEVAKLPDQFKIDVLGEALDANGALIENSEAEHRKFALMYEFDGDANKVRHVNYYCSASRPSIEGKTGKKDISTDTLDFTSRPAPDTSDVKARVKQGDTGYNTSYSSVYLKNAVTNSIAASTFTASKASSTDKPLTIISTDASNTVRNAKLNGANIGGINLTAAGLVLTIKGTWLASLAIGTYTILVEMTKGNAVAVTLTITA